MNAKLLLPCLLLLGTTAYAQDQTKTIPREQGDLIVNWGQPAPPPDQGRPDFGALDANGDGKLVLEETESHRLLHSDFIYADGNRNGSISRDELSRWNN